MMLYVTVELMGATQMRCQKSGFIMEGDVSFIYIYHIQKKETVEKFKSHETNSLLFISEKASRVQNSTCLVTSSNYVEAKTQ